MSTFYDKYRLCRSARRSVLCVGLDPDPERLPPSYKKGDIIEGAYEFIKDAIDATADFAIAYKPNLAFFEAFGPEGMRLFERIISVLRVRAPEALIIADAKRGDIGNTARAYARAFFEAYDCDAITVSPYMGLESYAPFLEFSDRGTIVLCNTSNPDADALQGVGDPPIYLRVAQEVQRQSREHTGQLGLVVGGTHDPKRIRAIRAAAPDLLFLVPGIGAQGGDLSHVLKAAGSDVLVNVSRGILYAGTISDVGKAASDYADRMRSLLSDL